ncbi:CHRD domain-containing protein [Allosphingosinicella sp.]|uniref:CHRD domain-containing protein n=1 Tax=Allosphingosinicella sp. TaxID=2823234 RepID=UPI002FC20BC2
MKTMLSIAALGTIAALSAAGVAAQEGGRPFTVEMTGAAEVPGPGDEDGSGTATLRVNPGQGRVCYTLDVEGIEPATAAHIHRTPPDPGPVVAPLDAPADGNSSGCADVERALAQEIIRDPSIFYVNVHNEDFPGGAVRGNLSR